MPDDKSPDDKTNDARGMNRRIGQADLADDRMGKNSLQGDDQTSVRNERQEQANARLEADDVMESFAKMDKEVRARRDLGKGNRSGK
ncbi:hypothetical protein [Chelativorans sp.]|uniref:hypothetical protein n=1 Tax=Chelativorans sp. TaxID=2203393 RepID=UPI0028124604|nr:hypothetical protein [Chelativorans sp.]